MKKKVKLNYEITRILEYQISPEYSEIDWDSLEIFLFADAQIRDNENH